MHQKVRGHFETDFLERTIDEPHNLRAKDDQMTSERRLHPPTLLLLAMVIYPASCDRSEAARLTIQVVTEDGQQLPCRLLVRPRGQECVIADNAVSLDIGPDRWMMSTGQTEIDVPAGPVTLRVEHGLEFERFKQEIDVPASGHTQQIVLKRWINMHELGYVCGENHLHVDTKSLTPMLVCEGLDIGSSLTWFNGPDQRRPIPPGVGSVRFLDFAGWKTPTTVYDSELEYTWGAVYIQNSPEPLPIPSNRRRPNLDYVKHAAASGAIVHYQGGWSREVALEALLGHVHCINICNNNFHMHRYQQRSHYSNLLEVDDFPVYPNTELGMMQMNTDTYYRLLNWGLKLAAGAGSATGVKQVPVGYNRAYVRVPNGNKEGAHSVEAFYQNWAAGNNFVTNGPVLLLTTQNDHKPGDTISFPKGEHEITLHVESQSGPNCELQRLEIIVNGTVAHTIPITNAHQAEGDVQLVIRQGSWIAARCVAHDTLLSDDELSVFSRGSDDDRFRMRPSRIRFAHTSPIYVTVDGRGAAVPTSLREGLKMLDRLEEFGRDNAAEEFLPDFIAGVTAARRKIMVQLED